MMRLIARLHAHIHARLVRMRLGSDTPAYAAALAEIARLRGGRRG
ncbi:MAG: hypothetical protein JWL91_2243 [Sphingomonas bacterium]|jgi:hypothetical protein|nr:hypothetical protein [Sphingomonas bacterium]MDB5690367.1 hypothetical protein [Sphingomonas bacterium]